jgi:hypothetical protein
LFYENPSDNRKKSAKKDDINPLVGWRVIRYNKICSEKQNNK